MTGIEGPIHQQLQISEQSRRSEALLTGCHLRLDTQGRQGWATSGIRPPIAEQGTGPVEKGSKSRIRR
jgi:hypothetical protein